MKYLGKSATTKAAKEGYLILRWSGDRGIPASSWSEVIQLAKQEMKERMDAGKGHSKFTVYDTDENGKPTGSGQQLASIHLLR